MPAFDDNRWSGASEPVIAYVYGETPPDFAAIAAAGFDVVVMDTSAAWYTPERIREANAHGLMAFAHPMSYPGLRPTTYG